jgi:sec-independent protein translocase protein TatA
MTPLALGGLGVPELLIILAVVLLLFGGSRLAGLGKSSGRALREFKEETKSLPGKDKNAAVVDPTLGEPTVTPEPLTPTDPGYQQPPRTNPAGAVDPSDARRDL